MTAEEYKKLSLREFDRAAEKFDDDDPSVYNMCRKDYPDVLAEVVKEPFSDLLDAGCGTGAMCWACSNGIARTKPIPVWICQKR